MISSGDGLCPDVCSSEDACVRRSLVGEASACDRRCVEEPISACSSTADGCCPSACNFVSDDDCRAQCEAVSTCSADDGCCPAACAHPADLDCPAAPPGGVGWPCRNADECTALETAISCFPSDLYPEGYCRQPCQTVSCPAGSRCSDGGWCLDECEPSSAGDCRPGYVCGMPRNSSFLACVPSPS